MNHKIKTSIFKFLSVLPANAGMHLYHFLQNFSENKNLTVKIKSSEDTFTTFSQICEKLNIKIKDSSIIEIGSGWLPIMPYFFLYKGKTKNVFTYDLNKHYQKKSIEHFNSVFSTEYNETILPIKNNAYSLPEGVNYFPSQNIINADIPKVDIIFSRFVLEHVTPGDILGMHKKFKSSLEKGSYIVHFISPSDHRAYSDKSLSLQDFLKYSPKEWDGIQTKFDYHNRLRLPQYLDIFKSLGYEIVYLTSDSTKEGTRSFDLFKQLTIHSDYQHYSDQELTAGNINIVLKV